MSADNGIYILRTTTPDGHEWRVRCATAIENIYWDEENKQLGVAINGQELLKYFGDCEVFTDEDRAWLHARDLYRELTVCEYGICEIVYDQPFP